MEPLLKLCPNCGEAFGRRAADSAAQWRARRFCSRQCYWASMVSKTGPPSKVCEHCGQRYERPRMRASTRWAARRFCSRACAFAWRQADEAGRFWVRVDTSGGPEACWLWTGAKREDGRGRFKRAGKWKYAYRVAYELVCGAIPERRHLHHTCEEPNCVNPAHLVALTVKEHIGGHHSGVPRSQEVREAISRGHKRSERSRAANEARRGVPRSPEVRQKIGEGHRRRRAA